MEERRIYSQIAGLLAAIENCEKAGNTEWIERHGDLLKRIMDTAPSGSGWDCGTKLAPESTPEKLIFHGSFHHMNEHGMYDGWTVHTVTVRASLLWGIDIKIGGRDRNQIKEYIHEMFDCWLREAELTPQNNAAVATMAAQFNARKEG